MLDNVDPIVKRFARSRWPLRVCVRTTQLIVALLGCGPNLVSDREAHQIHVANQTAASRALAARGLTALEPFDRADGIGDTAVRPVVIAHPELGRVIATAPRGDVYFAVDRGGVAHEIRVSRHYERTVREDVHGCDPGTAHGGHQQLPEPRAVATHPMSRYYKLKPEQTLGAAIELAVDYVDVNPVYLTGQACREIP